MTHPTDDELEALAIDLEEHAGWESEWQINITTKAASTIRKLKAERDALRPTSPDEAKELYQKLRVREPMFLEDWRRMGVGLQDIVDDLVDVIEWLRDEQDYAKSDRLRTLAGRLARQVPNYPVFDALNDDLVRTQARTWPNQLTIKESKSLEARAEKAEADRAALREALVKADELADAAQRLEHIARQNTDNAKVWEDACEAVCAALASYRKDRRD